MNLAFVCAKEDEQGPERTHETAIAMKRCRRCRNSQLTREQAIAVLAHPITPAQVKQWSGKDVTEEQIAARLAEVA